MKKYDFIIGYEHKAREFDSVCLLKMELDRRGYKTIIYNVSDESFKRGHGRYHAKVLVLPYGYGNIVVAYAVRYGIIFDKLINLQWEQALYREQEYDIENYKNPSGVCREAVHISWGKENVDRLVNRICLPKENVHVCGNMAMDFLKEPLLRTYLSKKHLLQKYSIDDEKKMILLVSSFKSAFNDSKLLEAEAKILGESRYIQHRIMLDSFWIIMGWLDTYLKDNSECIVIYRPHPGERRLWSKEIEEFMEALKSKYVNFRIIEDEKISQWMIVSDIILMCMSTSIAEAYRLGKRVVFMYPKELPYGLEISMFDNARRVQSLEQFVEEMNEEKTFPVLDENIKKYYSDNQEYTYLKVCDVCEKVFSDDKYTIRKESMESLRNQIKKDLKGKGYFKISIEYISFVQIVLKSIYWLIRFTSKGQRKCCEYEKEINRQKVEFASEKEIAKRICYYNTLLQGQKV